MASIDSSYVRQELKAIIATSKIIARLVEKTFERLETDPGSFDELEDVQPQIAGRYPKATFRKAYIEHRKHNFRLVFIHWSSDDEHDEHVDVIYAFARKRGYPINWDWVDEVCRGPDSS